MPFPKAVNVTKSHRCISTSAVSPPSAFRMDWLAEVAKLSGGKTLNVGMAIAWLAALDKASGVRMTRRTLAKWNVSREAYYDAIKRLNDSRLITVWKLPGRSHHIILMEPGGEGPLDLTTALQPH